MQIGGGIRLPLIAAVAAAAATGWLASRQNGQLPTRILKSIFTSGLESNCKTNLASSVCV